MLISIILLNVVLCYVTLYHACVTSCCYGTLGQCYIILCLCYVKFYLRWATLGLQAYVTLRYITLCCAMLRYITLCLSCVMLFHYITFGPCYD